MTKNTENSEESLEQKAQSGEQRARPGELLRAAREKRGLSTQEVADKLCLREQLIQEIEDNRFDPKVAATFTRGYLRAYAKFIGLQESDILESYEALELDKPIQGPMQSFSHKKNIERQDSRLMFFTYIVVAILIASFILFFIQKPSAEKNPESSLETDVNQTEKQALSAGQAEPSNLSGPSALAAEAEVQNLASEQQEQLEDNKAIQAETESTYATSEPTERAVRAELGHTEEKPRTTPEQSVEETLSEQVDEVPQPRPVTRTGTYLDAADPSAGELVLYFNEPSWIEVRDSNNKDEVLAVGTKQKGYNMPLGGAEAYDLILGALDVVEVYYQGQRVDLSDLPKNRVVPFQVPRVVQNVQQNDE